MTNLRKLTVIIGAIASVAIAGPGCDGGDSSTVGGSAGSGATAGGGAGGSTGGTGGGTTSSTGGTGGSTTTTGGGGTGAGGPTDVGAQGSNFVNAGGYAKSANFKMAFSLGQSTQNQNRSKSSNFTMQGGVIGATGSFK
ncbi:MAG: hypothetical protein IPK82_22375 [Polyangiaceae bacterium]|nr:hypothetical protein [Polyangiaceae bacterium]